MIKAFHILTLLLVAVAMGLSLAHALEFPGKLRLSKEQYVAVQAIYYPGFTLGGLIGEFGGIVALAVLLFLAWNGSAVAFWWAVAAFALMLSGNVVYWLFTHPVNGFWLKDTDLSGLGGAFFSLGTGAEAADWTKFRDVWEYSHVARCLLFTGAFLATAISLTV